MTESAGLQDASNPADTEGLEEAKRVALYCFVHEISFDDLASSTPEELLAWCEMFETVEGMSSESLRRAWIYIQRAVAQAAERPH